MQTKTRVVTLPIVYPANVNYRGTVRAADVMGTHPFKFEVLDTDYLKPIIKAKINYKEITRYGMYHYLIEHRENPQWITYYSNDGSTLLKRLHSPYQTVEADDVLDSMWETGVASISRGEQFLGIPVNTTNLHDAFGTYLDAYFRLSRGGIAPHVFNKFKGNSFKLHLPYGTYQSRPITGRAFVVFDEAEPDIEIVGSSRETVIDYVSRLIDTHLFVTDTNEFFVRTRAPSFRAGTVLQNAIQIHDVTNLPDPRIGTPDDELAAESVFFTERVDGSKLFQFPVDAILNSPLDMIRAIEQDPSLAETKRLSFFNSHSSEPYSIPKAKVVEGLRALAESAVVLIDPDFSKIENEHESDVLGSDESLFKLMSKAYVSMSETKKSVLHFDEKELKLLCAIRESLKHVTKQRHGNLFDPSRPRAVHKTIWVEAWKGILSKCPGAANMASAGSDPLIAFAYRLQERVADVDIFDAEMEIGRFQELIDQDLEHESIDNLILEELWRQVETSNEDDGYSPTHAKPHLKV